MEQIMVSDEEQQTVEQPEEDTSTVNSMSYEELSKISVGEPENEEEKELDKVETAQESEKEPEKEPVKETVSKEEYEKVLKRVKDQELFIARQGNEVGKARKELKEAREILEKKELEIGDNFFSSPIESTKQLQAIEKERADIDLQERKLQAREIVTKYREVITEHAPDFEENLSDIAKILLEEDHEDAVWVNEFKRNPYIVRGMPLDPGLLFQLNKRVSISKELTSLKAEVNKLTKENEELRKKPGKILSQIEQASKHTMSSGTPGSNKTGTLPKPVHMMSYAELEQATKRE